MSALRSVIAARVGLFATALFALCARCTASSTHNQVAAVHSVHSARSAPANDPDRDGVLGANDRCPRQPEDLDRVADEDGCPEVDQDCDRIADTVDVCPTQAEDRDEWQDNDGCPDTDNDGDSIVDRCDRCPNDREIVNTVEDDDGCPDTGPLQTLEWVVQRPIRLQFARDTVQLTEQQYFEVQSIALLLEHHPEIEQLTLTGHATAEEDSPVGLSLARAQAVQGALVVRGVDANRIVVRGVGAREPIDRGRTAEARANNRRVVPRVTRINEALAAARAQRNSTPTPTCEPEPDRPMAPGGCALASTR